MLDNEQPTVEVTANRTLIRMSFALEVSQIDRDARLSELTDDEIDSIIDGVLAAHRIASTPASEDGWQGIDSAPKDGTSIDLWVVFPDRGHRWPDAQWRGEGQHNCSGPANWCSRDGFPLHALVEAPVATHWRALPPAPEQQP